MEEYYPDAEVRALTRRERSSLKAALSRTVPGTHTSLRKALEDSMAGGDVYLRGASARAVVAPSAGDPPVADVLYDSQAPPALSGAGFIRAFRGTPGSPGGGSPDPREGYEGITAACDSLYINVKDEFLVDISGHGARDAARRVWRPYRGVSLEAWISVGGSRLLWSMIRALSAGYTVPANVKRIIYKAYRNSRSPDPVGMRAEFGGAEEASVAVAAMLSDMAGSLYPRKGLSEVFSKALAALLAIKEDECGELKREREKKESEAREKDRLEKEKERERLEKEKKEKEKEKEKEKDKEKKEKEKEKKEKEKKEKEKKEREKENKEKEKGKKNNNGNNN